MTNFKAIWRENGKKEIAIVCNVPDPDWARVKLHEHNSHAGETALIDCTPYQFEEDAE